MASTYIPGFTPALQSGADAGMARAQTELDRMRALQASAKPVAATPVVPEASGLGGVERLASFQADAAKIFADANARAEAANRAAEEERAIKNAQVQALSELYTGADPFGYSTNLYNDPAALAAEIQKEMPELANVNTLAAAQELQSKTLGDRHALWNLGLDTTRALEDQKYVDYLDQLRAQYPIEGLSSYGYGTVFPKELMQTAQLSPDPKVRKAALDQLQQYVGMSPEDAATLMFSPVIKGEGLRGLVTVAPNTPVALYDPSSGKVLYSGVGLDAGRTIATMARDLSNTSGSKANWQIMVGQPGATDISKFETVLAEYPDKSFLGSFADMVLPALGAVLVPGLGALGALGSAGAAGVGAAAGSALSGVAQGKSVGDILKNAAISGALAYGGGSLFGNAPSPTSALEKGATAAGSSLGSGTGTLAAKAAEVAGGNVITVISRAGLAPAIAGAGTGALAGGALNSILNNSLWNTPIDKAAQQPSGGGGYNAPAAGLDDAGNLITVTSRKLPSSALDSALAAAAAAPGTVNYGDKVFGKEPQPKQPPAEEEQPGWDVVAPKENLVVPPPASLPEIIPPLTSVVIPPLAGTELPNVPEQPPAEEEQPGWDVVANSEPRAPNLLPEIVPPLSSVDIPANAGDVQPVDKKSDLDKIIDYLRLAGLGVSAIGSLFDKGGSSGTPISAGRGSLNPVFSAQLPSANLPGLTGGATGPRPASALPQTTQDWYRYGYGPEQSFFNYVPQTAANTSQAYTGYAVGGYAVGGPGDGRDDKIPAMLSDGEYVIDAETVAMLGNGSSKAGARALDNFRVNVRKHKGRQLAKGQFSVKAKKPEQYLKGRK